MTEDPVKLYVVVMAILLCVLGFVAYTSHKEAQNFQGAIDSSGRNAEDLKGIASEVQLLTSQLGQSKLKKGFLSLIQEAMVDSGLPTYKIDAPKPSRVPGSKGKERRWVIQLRQSAGGRALTREELARFCQTVERYSQNILKTIEIRINRATGPNVPAAGKQDVVLNDVWRGTVVFGLRVVD